MNATTNVTLGTGKAVHAGTRTNENGAFDPKPVCPAAKAGAYVETAKAVTCKRCLKLIADEAAREAAFQDRLAASMEPVTEAHDLGFVPADEPATVAAEQPAEVREVREAAQAEAEFFAALAASMGPYDDEDNDDYEPDEDELNDPLIRRGVLVGGPVAADLTGYTYQGEDGFCTFGNKPDVAGSGCILAAGHPGQHEVSDGIGQTTVQATTDEPEAPQAGFCTFGVTAAHGSGCIRMAGHTGAHNVVEGDVDELDELPEVTVTMTDDRRGLIQGPGGRVGELLSVHDGRWSATDENHRFIVLDAASRDLAVCAWAVLMGLGQVAVRNASPEVVSVVLDDETKGRVSFNGNTGRIEYTGAWWCVRDENGAVVGPLRTTESAAAMAWAHHLGAQPGTNPVKVTVSGA